MTTAHIYRLIATFSDNRTPWNLRVLAVSVSAVSLLLHDVDGNVQHLVIIREQENAEQVPGDFLALVLN